MIKHQGDKRYSVSYVVHQKGEYIIFVKWGDDHIPGSPYRVVAWFKTCIFRWISMLFCTIIITTQSSFQERQLMLSNPLLFFFLLPFAFFCFYFLHYFDYYSFPTFKMMIQNDLCSSNYICFSLCFDIYVPKSELGKMFAL